MSPKRISPRSVRRKKSGQNTRANIPEPPPLPAGSGNFPIQFMFSVLVASLFCIVIALTPFTHNLDDIKIPIFLILGPILMVMALGMLAFGKAALPSRWVAGSLICYLLVMFLSTLNSDYSWAGWYQICFIWSALGFFLAAHCVGTQRKASEKFLRFLVILLLATNLIGCFMFDFFDNHKHFSGVAFLFRLIYGDDITGHINQVKPTRGNVTAMFNLLFTMSHADSNMQATILSRDFYAAFCVLYLPFSLLVSISPGPTRRPIMWRGLAITATLLSIICIFECKSKGEWIFGALSVMLLLPFIFRFGALSLSTKKKAWIIIIGMLMLLVVMAILQSPILFEKLKSIPLSIRSRSIIWAGSLGIFAAHPLLGGGPGTFYILFPQFRAPDYFLHEISNVTLFSHNYFLDVLCETGLLGLAPFLMFLGVLWFGSLRQALTHSDVRMKMMLAAALVAILGIFGSNLSSPNGRWVIGASSLWTVMGYLSGLYSQAQPAGAGEPAPRLHRHGILGRIPQKLNFHLIGGLSLFLAAFSFHEGRSYFSSALEYARGLKYMAPILDEARIRGDNISTEVMIMSLEKSAGHFAECLEIYPKNVSAYYKLGSVHVNIAKQYEKLASRLTGNKGAENAGKLRKRGDEYIVQAKKSYEKLMEYHPDYAEIHYNMGIVYPSYAKYLKKLALWSKDSETREKRLEEAGQYQDQAIRHLERMVTMSNKIEVALRAARQLELQGHTDRALKIYREARKRYPDDRDLLSSYIKTALQADSTRDIAESRFMLWQLDPSDRTTLGKLVRLAEDPGLHDILDRIVDRLSEINPLDPLLYSSRIILASHQDKPRAVLKLWEYYSKCGGKDLYVRELADKAARKLGIRGSYDPTLEVF